eukprot:CAMPEP_0194317882 /NCGR_PEP_ID=MMETSP0171-20130528/14567_1 /TAXON_ID=218684 /ORGANISM="Corethron pennatum, Strain L29A3" /LENGTH=809 /DNA_ID=CAMNT_0039074609 /DNA_START=145 /DNA_END=2574 /DNA_ORIENTATION=+
MDINPFESFPEMGGSLPPVPGRQPSSNSTHSGGPMGAGVAGGPKPVMNPGPAANGGPRPLGTGLTPNPDFTGIQSPPSQNNYNGGFNGPSRTMGGQHPQQQFNPNPFGNQQQQPPFGNQQPPPPGPGGFDPNGGYGMQQPQQPPQPSMGGGMQPSMGGGMQPSMGGGMQPSMGGGMQPSMGGGMQPSMGGGMGYPPQPGFGQQPPMQPPNGFNPYAPPPQGISRQQPPADPFAPQIQPPPPLTNQNSFSHGQPGGPQPGQGYQKPPPPQRAPSTSDISKGAIVPAGSTGPYGGINFNAPNPSPYPSPAPPSYGAPIPVQQPPAPHHDPWGPPVQQPPVPPQQPPERPPYDDSFGHSYPGPAAPAPPGVTPPMPPAGQTPNPPFGEDPWGFNPAPPAAAPVAPAPPANDPYSNAIVSTGQVGNQWGVMEDPFGGAFPQPQSSQAPPPPVDAIVPRVADQPDDDFLDFFKPNNPSVPPARPKSAESSPVPKEPSITKPADVPVEKEPMPTEQRSAGDLPSGGEWYDARIFTPTLGVMFFKPQELIDSLFLNTDRPTVDALDERPVVAFIVEGSSARSAGVELGHVLIKVNDIDVRNPKEASRLIKEGPRPLPLLFYVPDTTVVVAEGDHMVKYDTRDTSAPNSAKDWKPKYVVVGGIIAQPWMINMYRSKSEYDIAVIETQARRPVSVKVKQFNIRGAKIQNDWQGPQMVKYKNKLHPWRFIVVLPVSRNPIKISSPNLTQLKPVHEGIRRVLTAQQRDMPNQHQHPQHAQQGQNYGGHQGQGGHQQTERPQGQSAYPAARAIATERRSAP